VFRPYLIIAIQGSGIVRISELLASPAENKILDCGLPGSPGNPRSRSLFWAGEANNGFMHSSEHEEGLEKQNDTNQTIVVHQQSFKDVQWQVIVYLVRLSLFSQWDDASWIMCAIFMTFTMQTGFAILESGCGSLKNEVSCIHVLNSLFCTLLR
jgi:hypothetical protein